MASKENHSASTAGRPISRALDTDKLAVMASLDLTAGFDLVNVKLLIKRIYKTSPLIVCYFKSLTRFVKGLWSFV